MQALIERQCDSQLGVRDEEKFRSEGDGIWVFKKFQDRIYCYFDGNKVCMTHGLKKKRDRVPPSELKKAKDIRALNKK